jgi:hypothetical protein
MSKELDQLIEDSIHRDRDTALRKKVVEEKSLILREHQVDRDLGELEKNTNEIEKAKSVDFSVMTPEDVQALVKSNDEYMEAAKNSMVFINEEFGRIVPYFRKNLILIGGDTGDGKSTTVANIIHSTITRKNPATGKPGRVLVLSNEEAPEDFYNRVTCITRDWAYTNHDKFTEEQKAAFRESIPILAKNGRLTIIGDVYQGIPGWTTTIEGIELIFENLLKDNTIYDSVIIDYYQNVKRSKVNPKLNQYECQAKLAAVLDQMKLRYPGAIVLMAQMARLTDEEDTTPFNKRLKGSKEICDKSTFMCELIPERSLLRSKWCIWKSRFTESIGKSIYTGFDRGKFVPYSVEFQEKTAKMVDRNLEKKQAEKLGLTTKEEE